MGNNNKTAIKLGVLQHVKVILLITIPVYLREVHATKVRAINLHSDLIIYV